MREDGRVTLLSSEVGVEPVEGGMKRVENKIKVSNLKYCMTTPALSLL